MKSKYSSIEKIKVLDKGLVKDLVKAKKDLYYKDKNKLVDYDGVVHHSNDWFNYLVYNRANTDFDCAYLLAESKRRKAQKVREKITELILNNNAVFLTLTFRNDVLEKTSAITRRRYVARFLKDISGCYVANIDFSPDIGREHYHAVITQRVDLTKWCFGFAYAEKVRAHHNDVKRISKYITKLTAHALKVDATRLIYSRG